MPKVGVEPTTLAGYGSEPYAYTVPPLRPKRSFINIQDDTEVSLSDPLSINIPRIGI